MKNPTRFSAKKLMALLCILAVCAAGLAFAAIKFTNSAQTNANGNSVQTSDDLANSVTVYGNGVTFVTFQQAITVENDTSPIQFYLPSGALTDTLTVSGINVDQITTSAENQPIINTGDVITVCTENGNYTGTFISWDTSLLLQVNNQTLMIPTTTITMIILNEIVQVQGPKILVQVTTDSPPGNYQMNVSYLMSGPQWYPTYFIDLDTSILQCWATIENVENWNNVTLVLVSGGPHLAYDDSQVFQSDYAVPLAMAVSSPQMEFTSTTTDEYHEYTYGARVSFEEGTTAKLPLFNGTVNLRQEYFWSGGEVENRYHINNTLSEPLASGTIEFYRGEQWMGEDSIGYTPVNAEAIAIVNYADDIQVTSTLTKSIIQSNYEDQGTTLTIQNYKPTNVQILIQQDISGYDLVTSTPNATRTGSTLSWVINVDANSTATIYYEWQYSW
jgi:hypothetical protein